MTAAEQHREWGICVEADDGDVIIQMGDRIRVLSPREAQRFAYHLAQAYHEAGGSVRGPHGAWRLEETA